MLLKFLEFLQHFQTKPVQFYDQENIFRSMIFQISHFYWASIIPSQKILEFLLTFTFRKKSTYFFFLSEHEIPQSTLYTNWWLAVILSWFLCYIAKTNVFFLMIFLITVPLMSAERAWSYAMQLKFEMNSEARKKFHMINRWVLISNIAIFLDF